MVVSVWSAMISKFCFRPASKRWFSETSPSDHETLSVRCHVGIHVDFTSILHSHSYSVGPSSLVGSELGPAPPFPPMIVLEVQWPMALSLVCEVNLSCEPENQKRNKTEEEYYARNIIQSLQSNLLSTL